MRPMTQMSLGRFVLRSNPLGGAPTGKGVTLNGGNSLGAVLRGQQMAFWETTRYQETYRKSCIELAV
jgi:hypothetical protein